MAAQKNTIKKTDLRAKVLKSDIKSRTVTRVQHRSVPIIIKSKEKLLLINLKALTTPRSMIHTILFYINVFLPGAKLVRSNSVGMKGAPPAVMDVGDSMMGPGKAGGLPMGAARSTGGTWNTKKHNGIVLRLIQIWHMIIYGQESLLEPVNCKNKLVWFHSVRQLLDYIPFVFILSSSQLMKKNNHF